MTLALSAGIVLANVVYSAYALRQEWRREGRAGRSRPTGRLPGWAVGADDAGIREDRRGGAVSGLIGSGCGG